MSANKENLQEEYFALREALSKHISQNAPATALAKAERAYTLSETLYGYSHSETITVLFQKAWLQKKNGELAASLDAFIEVVKRCNEALLENHTLIPRCFEEISDIYMTGGYLDESVAFLEKARNAYEERDGEGSARAAEVSFRLAVLLERAGLQEEALELY